LTYHYVTIRPSLLINFAADIILSFTARNRRLRTTSNKGMAMKILQGKNVDELKEVINFRATEYSINGESISLSNKNEVVCVILEVGEIEAFKKISLEVGPGKRKPCQAGA
jgi:hypothetical protein